MFAILLPWAIRNWAVLGSPIFTRSDFGLELQVSNNDLATADLEKNVRTPVFQQLHPTTSVEQGEKVRVMGEVAYGNEKKQEAYRWIAAHPGPFLGLTIRRVALFWFPRMHRLWQSAIEGAVSLVGICGFLLALKRKERIAWVSSPVMVLFPAIYYLIQSSPRYRLPIEPFTFLFGAYLVSLWETPRMRTSSAAAN